MNVTIKNSVIKNRVKKVLILKMCEKNILNNEYTSVGWILTNRPYLNKKSGPKYKRYSHYWCTAIFGQFISLYWL